MGRPGHLGSPPHEILRTGPESARGIGGRVVVTETLAYLLGSRGEDLRGLAEGDISRVDIDASHGEQRDDRRGKRDQAGECGGGAQEMLIRGLGDDVRRRRFSGGQSRRERIAAGQRGGDPKRRLRPARGVGLETSIDHLDDPGIDHRAYARGERWRRRSRLLSAFRQAHRTIGRRARQQFEEQQAYGIQVGLRRKPSADDLLRRHIRGRARDLTRRVVVGETRQAEIGDANLSSAVEHHVGRLQVAMEDAAVVRRGKAGADLSNDLDGLVRRQPADAAQERRKVFAVHVLHRHERTAVPLADVMDPADIGMRDLTCGARLIAQARRQGGLVAAQKLQRNGLAEREIVGAIDLAHAAATEQADDAVARPEKGAWCERAVIDAAAGCPRTPRYVGRRRDWLRRQGRGDGRRIGGCAAHVACGGVRSSFGAANGADHRANLVTAPSSSFVT